MTLQIKCPGCAKTLKVSEQHRGKRVKCPGCEKVLAVGAASQMSAPTAVSAATAPATMSSTVGSDKMTVGCGCGAKLKVATSARGKQVQCPKCGQRLTVTGDPIIIGGTSNSMSGVLIGAGMAVFGALGAAWVVYSNFLSSAHEA